MFFRKSESQKNYAKLKKTYYNLFNEAIKHGHDYIHITNPTVEQEKIFRGFGKTTLITELAIKHHLIIFYKYESTRQAILRSAEFLKKSPPILKKISNIETFYRGNWFDEIVLIDEDISVDVVETIKKDCLNLTLIGFSRIDKNKQINK